MAVEVDIFNPQVSRVSHGLEGKTILIYGENNLGKTAQAVRADRPYVLACESGLNGQTGVAYNRVNNWAAFKKIVKQFTSPATIDKAKEMYRTIIVDEVYASSIFCQDYICQRLGITSFGENENSRVNAWQEYEKEYWREINKLVNSGFTVIFIAHAEEKDGFIRPKGDKRCLNPIIDNCDIVCYIKPNGVDEDGKEILSSAYFVRTNEFFARSRYTKMVPMIQTFTIEGLIEAINNAIAAEVEESGVDSISYAEQVAMNTDVPKTYDELMEELQKLGEKIAAAGKFDQIEDVVSSVLGTGKKASDLKKGQEQLMQVLIEELEGILEE